VQDRGPDDRNPEVLSEPTAARLLARASELDELRRAGSTVAELRAAAAEAGISAPAFDAALTELQQQAVQAPAPDVIRKPRRLGRVFGLAMASMIALLFGARMLFPVPGSSAPAVGISEETILLNCLARGDAAELVKRHFRTNGSNVTIDIRTSGALIVRGTPQQVETARTVIEDFERENANSCAIPPAPAPAP
jgi:hypothetical protein